MILTEAQTTWTMNIIIRALMYLVQSYHEYFERRNDNLYGSKKVKLPKAELYVIFTGKRVSKPEYVSLSEEFWGGEECAIDVKVKYNLEVNYEHLADCSITMNIKSKEAGNFTLS